MLVDLLKTRSRSAHSILYCDSYPANTIYRGLAAKLNQVSGPGLARAVRYFATREHAAGNATLFPTPTPVSHLEDIYIFDNKYEAQVCGFSRMQEMHFRVRFPFWMMSNYADSA